MKNKGFTLMELLGVIVILGVLALVVFPPIVKQINNAKEGISSATGALIIDASKDYYEDNKSNYKKIDGVSYCIDVSTLIEKNYLNEKLKDKDLNDIDGSKQVKLTYQNGLFEFNVVDECVISLSRNGIEVAIEQEVLEDGLYESEIDEGRFVYRGSNPNNYLMLPEAGVDTLYRIISFEDDGTIKVIRDESIGQMAWDTNVDIFAEDGVTIIASPRNNEQNSYCNYVESNKGCNVWGNQNNTYSNGELLKNSFYYKFYLNDVDNQIMHTNSNKTVFQDSSLNVYLNKYWINQQNLSNYVAIHPFSVGGIYYHFSTYDGDDKGLKKERQEEKFETWYGMVGLMSATEIVESSSNSRCTSVYSNYYYNKNHFYDSNGDGVKEQNNNNWPCTVDNWIYKRLTEWTISSYIESYFYVFRLNGGYIGISNAATSEYVHVRPSFYLKASIILSGKGTEENPYTIKQV